MANRETITDWVLDILRSYVAVPSIESRQSLQRDLRLFPLDIVQIVEEFERRRGMTVSLNAVAGAATVGDLIDAFADAAATNDEDSATDSDLDSRYGNSTFRGFAVAISRVDRQDRWQRNHVARWRSRRSGSGRDIRR
jgi:acyl carrier protein